jgi:hypothetical protein
MAKFYQAVLKPMKNDKEVLESAYPNLVDTKYMPTMKERLGDAECPNCKDEGITNKKETRWMMLADETVAVTQGGKAYIECLDCGHTTHL